MKCSICHKPMIDARIYDSEGTIPLYGGHKEYDKNKNLLNWLVCINTVCQHKEKQREAA